MEITSLLMDLCLGLGLVFCEEPPSVALPEQDVAVFEYQTRPEPQAEPVPEPEISFAPLVIYRETTVPEPIPEPDPEIIAYHRLLALRRGVAIENGFAGKSFPALTTRTASAEATLTALSVAPSLDFNFSTRPTTRYQYPAQESGLPIDNPRIVRADRYINAIFETGVNSNLSSADGGEAILVVENNVYGYHGRKILIPKGSRLICDYGAADHANSTRLGFTCKRILLSDSAVEIYQIASKVGDAQGHGGVSGDVDRRFWAKYGTAFLLAGVSPAVRVAAGSINSKNNANLATSVNAGAEELSKKFGEITASVLEDKINLKPIIRIAQGTPVTIRPSKDWYIPLPDRNLNNDFGETL